MKTRNSMLQELEKIKSQIIDFTLIFASILGVVTYVLSLLKLVSYGFTFQYISDLLVILAIVFVAIYRFRLTSKLKSIVILSALFLLIFYDTFQFGILSTNKSLIVLVPFFSFLIFSIRTSVVIFIATLTIHIGIGILHVNGVLDNGYYPMEYVSKFRPLAIDTLIITIVSLAIVAIVRSLSKNFFRFYQRIEENHEALARSERNYREIFNASTDAIFIHDLNGVVLDVNDSMLEMYNYTREEFTDINFDRIVSGIPPYDVKNAQKMLQKGISTGKHRFDWQARKKEGKIFWVEVMLSRTSIGGEDRLLAVVRDIDEKKEMAIQLEKYKVKLEHLVEERTAELSVVNKKLTKNNDVLKAQKNELEETLLKLQDTQKKLIQNDKMASLGVLTAGVAHEINNPLNFIQAGIYSIENLVNEHAVLKSHKKLKSNFKKLLANMQTGVERVADIVSGLNNFSGQSNSYLQQCNIQEIIENCLLIIKGKIKDRIKIETNFETKSTILEGNSGKLHQAFLNILINAMQSIKEKGVIGIKIIEQGDQLLVKIIDDGSGIAKDNLAKIFDPFFTTKVMEKGIGLGLSITYGIVKDHNGVIEFKSELNKGTEVTVLLPKEQPVYG